MKAETCFRTGPSGKDLDVHAQHAGWRGTGEDCHPLSPVPLVFDFQSNQQRPEDD